jgi:hypothetical protein
MIIHVVTVWLYMQLLYDYTCSYCMIVHAVTVWLYMQLLYDYTCSYCMILHAVTVWLCMQLLYDARKFRRRQLLSYTFTLYVHCNLARMIWMRDFRDRLVTGLISLAGLFDSRPALLISNGSLRHTISWNEYFCWALYLNGTMGQVARFVRRSFVGLDLRIGL